MVDSVWQSFMGMKERDGGDSKISVREERETPLGGRVVSRDKRRLCVKCDI